MNALIHHVNVTVPRDPEATAAFVWVVMGMTKYQNLTPRVDVAVHGFR
jgi:hypothetical protein